MLNYKQIWHGIKPIRWLNKFNLTPYLINLPELSHRVKSELYFMSTRGLSCLDKLEGTALSHYKRLPIQTQAKAYYVHRSFAEEL